VTEADRGRARLQPTHSFQPGDIVAVSHPVAMSDGASPGRDDMVYARVIDCTQGSASDGSFGLSNLRVDDGAATSASRRGLSAHAIVASLRSVTSADCHVFGPISSDVAAAEAAIDTGARDSHDAGAHASASASASDASTAAATATDEAHPTGTADASARLQAPGVRELVAAAQALLERAGVPIDQDAVTVRAEAIRARQAEAEALKRATEAEAVRATATSALGASLDAFTCRICMVSLANHMLVPSGQLICKGCGGRIDGSCPWTRQRVTACIKVTLPLDDIAKAASDAGLASTLPAEADE
jgi:pyruvate/2-oxoglutarate dehydrogenase complex dihydrolipoamide acyltransferase (E2) component